MLPAKQTRSQRRLSASQTKPVHAPAAMTDAAEPPNAWRSASSDRFEGGKGLVDDESDMDVPF
jgi:hypothetical protein